MLTSNTKLKRDGIWSFSLPAIKTCPMAGTCKDGCYATMGNYRFPSVQVALTRNWHATRNPEFVPEMKAEIAKKKAKIVRIHSSGDFYDWRYAQKWISIARRCPEVEFYAYTKMISMFRKWTIDVSNFRLIYSEGGLVSPHPETERHSRVFSNLDELLQAGYVDASENDIVAATTPSLKIGLIYHGDKSKKWSTN